MKPRVHILNPAFKYTNSGESDIRKTFAKERARLKAEAAAKQARSVNVRPITQRKEKQHG